MVSYNARAKNMKESSVMVTCLKGNIVDKIAHIMETLLIICNKDKGRRLILTERFI